MKILFLLFIFSGLGCFAKQSKDLVGKYDCTWSRTTDKKDKILPFKKEDKIVLDIKSEADISFSKNDKLIYFCKKKIDSKDQNFPGKFDCNDAEEPNTYDIFFWLDANLVAGKRKGIVKVDVPYPPLPGKKYLDPRTHQGYPTAIDEFQCEIKK